MTNTHMTNTHVPQLSIADRPRYDCRNAYVETLAELAHENHRIVGVVNDSVGSSKLDAFKRAFPDRLINVGIAEQDMSQPRAVF
jgi:transketolase